MTPQPRPRVAVRPGGARSLCLTIAAVAPLGLAACGGEPLHPSKRKNPPDEIPPGEGLLSGKEGGWTIYRD